MKRTEKKKDLRSRRSLKDNIENELFIVSGVGDGGGGVVGRVMGGKKRGMRRNDHHRSLCTKKGDITWSKKKGERGARAENSSEKIIFVVCV